MRYIRFDDYPVARPYHTDQRPRQWVVDNLRLMCDVMNESQTPFILGVIPLRITDEDVDILNDALAGGNGMAVMHGFTHGLDRWESVEKNHRNGGEFFGRDISYLKAQYVLSFNRMSDLQAFDENHFIAPFNLYNQNLVCAISGCGVKYLHTADKEYDEYGYDKIKMYGVDVVMAEYGKTYGHIQQVLDGDDGYSQICLHWMIDAQQDKGWLKKYKQLCERLK